MSEVVAHIDINTKFFREERWDYLRHAFFLLEKKVKEKIHASQMYYVLRDAGIVHDKTMQRPCRENNYRPPARLAPLAVQGKVFRLKAHKDAELGRYTLSHEFLEAKPT
jgi:hypothetical protein